MSVYEMILSLDRISRFKLPEQKLKRVYVETICAHLIKPSLKKDDILTFDNQTLADYFELIWNFSIKENFNELNDDFTLNDNFINEEKKCYVLDKSQLQLFPKTADFKTLINNIKKSQIPNNFPDYKTPVKIVLTEGVTEEIVLPEFSKTISYNWEQNGVKILSTGGKSKIISNYKLYKDNLKIPIYVLLDNDAKDIFSKLKDDFRKIDSGHLITCGEIEDIIPVNFFKNAINHEYKLQSKISISDFDANLSMVQNLKNIFKQNGFGEFKKAKVAVLIKEAITSKSVVDGELFDILNEIKTL